MRTIYRVSTKSGFYRTFHATEAEAQERINSNPQDELVISTIEIEDKQKWYAVYISNDSFCTDFDAMYCAATAEYQARAIGEQYIRQWDLYGQRIQRIQRVC